MMLQERSLSALVQIKGARIRQVVLGSLGEFLFATNIEIITFSMWLARDLKLGRHVSCVGVHYYAFSVFPVG